jgi:hypothetical protein
MKKLDAAGKFISQETTVLADKANKAFQTTCAEIGVTVDKADAAFPRP